MILVVDHYDSFTFNLVRYLHLLGETTRVVEYDRVDPAEAGSGHWSGILLSPGPRRPEDIPGTLALIRALPDDLPVLGVCLGHQALAYAMGAGIVRAPRPMHGMLSDLHHDGRGLFCGLPDPLTVTRYHSLVVDPDTLPSCLAVTAWTGDGLVMGLRHRERPVETVQFHPEALCTQNGLELLENFVRMLRPRGTGKDVAL